MIAQAAHIVNMDAGARRNILQRAADINAVFPDIGARRNIPQRDLERERDLFAGLQAFGNRRAGRKRPDRRCNIVIRSKIKIG